MPKFAVVFPGQGSQSVGMLADSADGVRPYFDRASSVLGYDLWALVQDGPEDQLNQTEFTQPALLTASVALYEVARAGGMPEPAAVAGHSLGEYSALVAASVFTLEDAVSLVQQRGQFMQTAVPVGEGGMAAILGVDDDQVITICEQVSTESAVVEAANFNAPGQVVIAGQTAALSRAIEACKEAGAKRAMPLAVSAPFHSRLMKPAAEKMSAALAAVTMNAPEIRIVQNVDAGFTASVEDIREKLVQQMYSAVQWTRCVNTLAADGVEQLVECGPGRVLAGLGKRINRELTNSNIGSTETAAALAVELSA